LLVVAVVVVEVVVVVVALGIEKYDPIRFDSIRLNDAAAQYCMMYRIQYSKWRLLDWLLPGR